MQRIGYYKSCSLQASAKNYTSSIEKFFSNLSVELIPVKDWNCCGASSAHGADELLAISLSARNLALAESQDITTLMVPCSACYNQLKQASDKLKGNDFDLKEINEIIHPLKYYGTLQVKNILEILWNDIGFDRISPHIKTKFRGLPLVCYYGCYLTRIPGSPSFDDCENPHIMEKLLEVTGAVTLDWPFKTDCCGASLGICDEELSLKLCKKLLDMVKKVGAEAIVTTCPLCHTNLEMNQLRLNRDKNNSYFIPVFYITDILGIVTDCRFDKIHWKRYFINPLEIIEKYLMKGEF